MSKSNVDNRSNQLNTNNDAYYLSRGYEGRDDYCGDGDGVAAGFKGYSAPMQIPSPTPLQSSTEEVMAGIVRNMTAGKASLSICDYLNYIFEGTFVEGVCEGSSVRLTMSRSAAEMVQFDLLVAETRRWIARHRRIVRHCVESVALTQDGRNWVDVY